MTRDSTTACLPQSEIETTEHLFDNWFDPIETGLRDRVRELLQAMLEGELDEVLARSRYARCAKPACGNAENTVGVTGHRHGHRSRSLLGTFGRLEIEMPRARLNTADGKTTEWKSQALRAYQRRSFGVDYCPFIGNRLLSGDFCNKICTNAKCRNVRSRAALEAGQRTLSKLHSSLGCAWHLITRRSARSGCGN